MREFPLGGVRVGTDSPAFIIAELSCNHLHDKSVACRIVRAAAEAGAQALKLQTLTPDTMTIDCDLPAFRISNGSPWDGRTLYELYQETALPYEWHWELWEYAESLGLVCFSTPYDISAVEFLDQFDPAAYKIASFEIRDLPLIREVARRGRPVILSTGIADLRDIDEAVAACRESGNEQIALLQCTSAYPTPLNEVNLRTLPDLESRFDVVVGVSDHTTGIEVALGSVVLGGRVIEKHLTLDRTLGGPDAAFSLEPYEFAELVRSVRRMEVALGEMTYERTERKRAGEVFARSLFFVRSLQAGQSVGEKDIRSIRPGNGLAPKHWDEVVGRRLARSVEVGTPVTWELLE